MIHFECDYTEGAHERIIARLTETNLEQTTGYGLDGHCERAKAYIKRELGREDVDVHFLVGGTQANKIIIASALRPHQGAIAAASGHISVHETGAVEATGHKVIVIPSENGKLCAAEVKRCYDAHHNDVTHEHIVQPGLVYISHPTESGTTYSYSELSELSRVCRECGLYLMLDGARLGYALAADDNELTLSDIASLCDVFYIGGTKVGALFGEAVVIVNDALKRDFRYIIKQNGGMLAKGRLLGIQFETLFEDTLYYDISRHAVAMAMRIRDALRRKGIGFLFESTTNQQFPIFSDAELEKLERRYAFSFCEKTGARHSAVRICTSWATDANNVDMLIRDIEAL